MTDNTPLNADDELALWESMFGSLTEARAGDYVAHYRDFIRRLKVYRKKHELEARIDELENRLRAQFIPSHWERLRSETNSWAKYVDRRIGELKQELEKL